MCGVDTVQGANFTIVEEAGKVAIFKGSKNVSGWHKGNPSVTDFSETDFLWVDYTDEESVFCSVLLHKSGKVLIEDNTGNFFKFIRSKGGIGKNEKVLGSKVFLLWDFWNVLNGACAFYNCKGEKVSDDYNDIEGDVKPIYKGFFIAQKEKNGKYAVYLLDENGNDIEISKDYDRIEWAIDDVSLSCPEVNDLIVVKEDKKYAIFRIDVKNARIKRITGWVNYFPDREISIMEGYFEGVLFESDFEGKPFRKVIRFDLNGNVM